MIYYVKTVFPKKQLFWSKKSTTLRFIPLSIWAENDSKTQNFKFYAKIVKDIIMIIYVSNWTLVTLLTINTSPGGQRMNSRAFSIKDENRPKVRSIKIALYLNPFPGPIKLYGP